MDIKLEKKLFKKYPKIFRQKDLSMNQTCMCWGISCGNGWYQLLDDLCGSIQRYIDCTSGYRDGKEWKPEQVEAVQIKEKFGGLRFYTNYNDDIVEGMIHYAEYLADHTCEECGSKEKVFQTKGWIKTICKKCYKKLGKKK